MLAASVERCKLLDVQFICKELYQREPQQQGVQQQGPQQQASQQQGLQQWQQQQQAFTVVHQQQDGLQSLEHERVWGDSTADAGPVQQQRPLCKRLSMRVVLQRLLALPLSDKAADAQLDTNTWGQADSSWQQRGLQGCGQVQQVAYTCTLEYPAFYIQVGVDSACVKTGSVCCML